MYSIDGQVLISLGGLNLTQWAVVQCSWWWESRKYPLSALLVCRNKTRNASVLIQFTYNLPTTFFTWSICEQWYSVAPQQMRKYPLSAPLVCCNSNTLQVNVSVFIQHLEYGLSNLLVLVILSKDRLKLHSYWPDLRLKTVCFVWCMFTIVPSESNDPESHWTCTTCQYTVLI